MKDPMFARASPIERMGVLAGAGPICMYLPAVGTKMGLKGGNR